MSSEGGRGIEEQQRRSPKATNYRFDTPIGASFPTYLETVMCVLL